VLGPCSRFSALNDLQDPSSWVAPPLCTLKRLHGDLLQQYDCTEQSAVAQPAQPSECEGVGVRPRWTQAAALLPTRTHTRSLTRRRLPGQRQRQAPPTATRPSSFDIQAESGVPNGVFQLSGPAVPASPEVRHPYPAPCHETAHQELGVLQGPASALRRQALRGTVPGSPPSEAQGHCR